MSLAVLMVSPAEGLDECLRELKQHLGLDIEVAANRRAAQHALGQRQYAALLLDTQWVESDPDGTDTLCHQAGLAIPVQINFALSSPSRVVREVRGALVRREQEMALSMRAAAAAIDMEVKNAVTALLLQSQLALQAEDLSAAAREKIHNIIQLSEDLRNKVEVTQG